MSELQPSRPTLLLPTHDTARFTCGQPPLDRFIREFALENQKSGKSRTYVVARGGRVVAYYSLAPGGIAPELCTTRVAAGQDSQPVPVILIGRLAVDVSVQGRRIGSHMVLDALRRCVAGAEVIGGRAVLVHALDGPARAFWPRNDFESASADGKRMMMLMKDVRKALGL